MEALEHTNPLWNSNLCVPSRLKCMFVVWYVIGSSIGIFCIRGKDIESDRMFPKEESNTNDLNSDHVAVKHTIHTENSPPPLNTYPNNHRMDDNINDLPSITVEPSIITSSCTAFINSFADAASYYTKCSIIHSRPFRFCELCAQDYLQAKDRYSLILKGSSEDEQGARCSDVILNSDKIQLVTKTMNFIEDTWESCNCQNCFDPYTRLNDTSTAHLSNETLTFFQKVNETWECFNNFSEGEIIPFGPHGNFTFNKTVCVKCEDIYKDLNHYYEELEEKYSKGTCMDMVDAMNYTRLLWSKDFSCSKKSGDLLPVLLLSGFFSLLPVIFYGSSKAFGSRREKKLLKQKRFRDAHNADSTSIPSNGQNTVAS